MSETKVTIPNLLTNTLPNKGDIFFLTVGTENRYFINRESVIFDTVLKKYVKPYRGGGYSCIKILPKRKVLYVANAIANAFLDGYRKGFKVGHINGDKMDTTLSNLVWVRKKKTLDLEGKIIGNLKVIRSVEAGDVNFSNKYFSWLCECSCGSTKLIRTGDLTRANESISCGCLLKEIRAANATTHGLHKHYLYSTWLGIKDRCYNKRAQSFTEYGGRGITVCDRWLNSFENFLEDMGDKPSNRHSIDRIDVDGDYSPENCRWADRSVQGFNTRRRKNNTSGRTGIYPYEGKWDANLCGKRLGRFSTFEEACQVRQAAEIEKYGFSKE